jgi:hypothetical protein
MPSGFRRADERADDVLREVLGAGLSGVGDGAARTGRRRAARVIEDDDGFGGHQQRNGQERAEGQRLGFHARILHPARRRACTSG